MGCRAFVEKAGERVWENFSDATNPVGSPDDDASIFIGRNRLVAYDLTSESPNNANGDLTSKTDGAGTTAYEYDALGNLRKVTPPTGPVIDYVIDGANRRVGKKSGGTLVQQFLYSSDLRVVAELDGAGVVISRFVYGTRVNVPEYIVKGSNTYRVVTDHLGSVRRVVDVSSGAVAQAIEFDEFGVVLSDSTPGFQPFGFAGGLIDGGSGFVRFGRRDYEARAGRWTSKDPINFKGGDTNLYGYVVAEPINAIDPDGLWRKDPSDTGFGDFGSEPPPIGGTVIGDELPCHGGIKGSFEPDPECAKDCKDARNSCLWRCTGSPSCMLGCYLGEAFCRITCPPAGSDPLPGDPDPDPKPDPPSKH